MTPLTTTAADDAWQAGVDEAKTSAQAVVGQAGRTTSEAKTETL